MTRCGTGIDLYGNGIAVRHCTLFDIDGVGVYSGMSGSVFEVSDTIIASTGAWAIQRYWSAPTTIERLLIHDTNQSNPPNLPDAGPFMQYLAEGFPGGFGVWGEFVPSPGPVFEDDPLFAAPESGDVRLQAGSPAIDAGDPAAVVDPAAPYDLLGYGHRCVDDGDFDGVEQTDLGALEFGGLLTNAGLDGTPLDLGSKGSCLLLPSPLLPLAVGILPVGVTATVVAGTLPSAAAGLQVGFQALQKGPSPSDGLHWTNLERLTILS